MARGRKAADKPYNRPADEAKRLAQFVTVRPDDVLRGPELPEREWHPQTQRWWETWRKSPQAQTFTDADWDFLMDTAFLHHELWSGTIGVAAELRQRVSKFGASPEDRLRLKLRIDDAVEQVVEDSSMPDDRKARLKAVVNE